MFLEYTSKHSAVSRSCLRQRGVCGTFGERREGESRSGRQRKSERHVLSCRVRGRQGTWESDDRIGTESQSIDTSKQQQRGNFSVAGISLEPFRLRKKETLGLMPAAFLPCGWADLDCWGFSTSTEKFGLHFAVNNLFGSASRRSWRASG